MPPATRRQARTRQSLEAEDDPSMEMAGEEILNEPDIMDRPALSTDVYPDEEEQEEEPDVFPPPGLKEISSLASWTVSTAKPGNGVAALRSPDLAHFWQSDGPQPHLLSIHFFKLVSIVHIRLFLDFENDESYTPTKIQFLAGMSVHDIQEFAELSVSEPQGWYEVSFDNVGRVDPEDESDEEDPRKDVDWSKRPVLRAFLIQVRILENHQNGKDTHLRAVQLFARDDSEVHRKPTNEAKTALPVRKAPQLAAKRKQQNNVKMASWMMEPDLR
ncbi:hypothetical protein D0861_04835 [Hortaea werneckii]|uniref:DOC domain-containing protein n=1 Tax=Hortaea werneckii TaxID=91943 RepID=A0A3M7FHW6_HORWE|nr:hypothetical protein D0861_04835 [Hortaea werneckii]